MRQIGSAYSSALDRDGTEPRTRTRPSPDVWSPLEYAAHMSDVVLLFSRRIEAILREQQPQLEVMAHDEIVALGRYNLLDPQRLAEETRDTARSLATTLDGLEPIDSAHRGFRDGEERTVLEITRRAVHESRHHLQDIARALRLPAADDPPSPTS